MTRDARADKALGWAWVAAVFCASAYVWSESVEEARREGSEWVGARLRACSYLRGEGPGEGGFQQHCALLAFVCPSRLP